MQGLWKALRSGIIIILFLAAAAGCSGTYGLQRSALVQGKYFYGKGDYMQAREHFEEAVRYGRDPEVLAYLAVIRYRTQDLRGAMELIGEAGDIDARSPVFLRIAGYRALILLGKEGDGGLPALKDYVDMYSYSYPLDSLRDVKAMAESGKVDRERLLDLIESQVSWYEKDVEQFRSTGTGYFDRHTDTSAY